MTHLDRSIALLLALAVGGCAASVKPDSETPPPQPASDDWAAFAPPGFSVTRVERGDLDADGREDALVVATRDRSDPQWRFAPRALSIALARPEGGFALAAQNTTLAACAACGGRFGDGLVRTAIENAAVVIVNEGGSATSGWSNRYTFKRDATTGAWRLDGYAAVVSSQRDQASKRVEQSSEDFGARPFEGLSPKDLPIPKLD